MNNAIFEATKLTEDYRDMVNDLVGTYYTATDSERDFVNALSTYEMPVEQLTAMAAAGELHASNFEYMANQNTEFVKAMEEAGISTSEAVAYFYELAKSEKTVSDNTEDLTDDVGMTASELEDLAKTIEATESSISTLNKYIQTLGEGNGLTAEQVLGLVDTYGLLLDQFTLTEQGYTIEVSALEKLREAQIKEAITAQESQIQQTLIIKENVLERLKAYGIEIEQITNLAEAQTALSLLQSDIVKESTMKRLKYLGRLLTVRKATDLM